MMGGRFFRACAPRCGRAVAFRRGNASAPPRGEHALGPLRDDRGATGMLEFALVAPLLLLILLGGINLALVQHTREMATVAATVAARAGAVSWNANDVSPNGQTAGEDFLTAMGMGSDPTNCTASGTGSGFGAVTVTGGKVPGADVVAEVDWCYLNLFAGLANYFRGGTHAAQFGGTVTMTMRKEGW